MPLIRCLTCNTPTEKRDMRRGRCEGCESDRKAIRNRSAAELGPCPQDVPCWSCGEMARAKDPMTWGHLTPISEGGKTALPQHLTCNSGMRDR